MPRSVKIKLDRINSVRPAQHASGWFIAFRNCKKFISNVKQWLQANIDNQLHEKDLVLDNKDLLFFIDKWEKQNETV